MDVFLISLGPGKKYDGIKYEGIKNKSLVRNMFLHNFLYQFFFVASSFAKISNQWIWGDIV